MSEYNPAEEKPERTYVEVSPEEIQPAGVWEYQPAISYAEQQSYWDDPQRIARYATVIESAPPGWEAPPWLDTQKILQARDELEKRNDYQPWYDWSKLDPNDPFSQFLRTIKDPPNEARFPGEREETITTTLPDGRIYTGTLKGAIEAYQETAAKAKGGEQSGLPYGIKAADWNALEPWQQYYLTMFVPQSQVANRPEASRVAASTVTALPVALGAYKVGSLLGQPVGVAAALAAVAAMGYQNYTGTEIPVLSDILKILNKPAEWTEQTIGLVEQAVSKDDGIKDILKDLPAAWKAGRLTYETGDLSNEFINWFAKGATVVDQAFRGENYKDPLAWLAGISGVGIPIYYGYKAVNAPVRTAGRNEVWQISKGYTQPVSLIGPRSTAALGEARKRIAAGEDPTVVWADFMDRFGDSGTFGDFVSQTLFDPMNVVPAAEGKTGKAISKALGKEGLAKAFESTTGKWYIDALPFGVQQAAEAITGKQGSQGLMGALRTYKESVRAGQVPKPAGGWDLFDRTVAGLTKEGEFKELVPVDRKTGVEAWGAKLRDLTPDAKAVLYADTAQDNIGVRVFGIDVSDADAAVRDTGNIFREVGGTSARATGLVGQTMLDSPATATTQAAYNSFARSGKLETLEAEWAAARPKRADLITIASEMPGLVSERLAKALEGQPDKLLQTKMSKLVDLLKNDPQAVWDYLAKATSEPAKGLLDKYQSIQNMKDWFAQFTGEPIKGSNKRTNTLEWDARAWQTKVMLAFMDHTEGFLVDYYHLKPDSSFYRAMNLLKQAQSMVLLDLNPGYLINNALNNWVTRAADGVFGFMTKGQIDEFFDRFGIKPARLNEGIGPGGMTREGGAGRIEKATQVDSGKIAEIDRALRKARRLGIASKLLGALEASESRSVYQIAISRMWNQLWRRGDGLPRMNAALEATLKRINPDLPEMLYRAAESGMNMGEIERAIFGEAVRTSVKSHIDEAAAKIAPGQEAVVKEVFEATGLEKALEDELAKAQTPDEQEAAIQRFEEKVQDVIDDRLDRQIETEAESVRDQVAAEGWSAAMKVFTDYQVRYWELWARHFERIDELVKTTADDPAARRQAWRAQRAWDRKAFRRANAFELQAFKGIIDALGIESEAAQLFIAEIDGMQRAWREAYEGYNVDPQTGLRLNADDVAAGKPYRHIDGRDDIWERFFTTDWGSEKARSAAADEARRQVKALMETATRAELESRERADTLFVGIWREVAGEEGAKGAKEWRERVTNVRKEMIEQREAMRRKVEDPTVKLEDARKMAMEFWTKTYTPLIAQLTRAEMNGAHRLAPMGAKASKNGGGAKKVKAHAIKEQVEAKAAEAVQAARRRLKRAEFKKQMQEAFGATDAEAAAMMIITDMHAERWAEGKKGIAPDDWYEVRIAGVEKGDGGESLTQAAEGSPKGSVYFLEDGKAIIRAYNAGDVSTMMHELGHIFRRDLVEADRLAIGEWYGFKGAAEFDAAQAKFDELSQLKQKGLDQLTPEEQARQTALNQDAELQKFIAGEEAFARAWERYLAEGEAPSEKLKSVFQRFTDWLLKIYAKATGQEYSLQAGKYLDQSNSPLSGIDLKTKLSDGRYLRDVFDNMLINEEIAAKYRAERGNLISERWKEKYFIELPDAAKITEREKINALMDKLSDVPVREWDAGVRRATETAVSQLMAEVEIAENGMRIQAPDGTWTGISSTYPDWWSEVSGLKYRDMTGRAAVTQALRDMTFGTEFEGKSLMLKKLRSMALGMSADDPAIRRAAGLPIYEQQIFDARMIETEISAAKRRYRDLVVIGDSNALEIYMRKINDLLEQANGLYEKILPEDQPTDGVSYQGEALKLRREIDKALEAVMAALEWNEQERTAYILSGKKNEIYRLAHEHGIFTADAQGRLTNTHLLNALNKAEYQEAAGLKPQKYNSVGEVSLEDARKILEARKKIKEAEANAPAFRKPSEAEKQETPPEQRFNPAAAEGEAKPVQTEMFSSGEDLPLMSGTPVRVEEQVFAPKETEPQPALIDMREQVKGIEPKRVEGEAPELEIGKAAAEAEPVKPTTFEPEKAITWRREVEDGTGAIRYVLVDENGNEFSTGWRKDTNEAFYDFAEIGKDNPKLLRLLIKIDEAEVFVPVKPFEYGGMMVDKAWRYGGDIIAYVPADETRLPTMTSMGDKRAKVLGLDAKNPNEWVYATEDGKFHRTGRESDPSLLKQEGAPAQAEPPEPVAPLGATPVPLQDGHVLDEINHQTVKPILEQVREQLQAERAKKTVKFADLPETEQAAVREWLKDVQRSMADTKYAAMRYGEMMRDQVLLNYRAQTGADKLINVIFPYQFWYTRTMINWASRMVDKPGWFAFYARLKQAQEKMEKKGVPSRFAGKMRVLAPYLPEWMGGGYWIDPLKQIFPFDSFGQPWEQARMDKARQAQAAISILRDMEKDGKLTTAEMNDAIESKSGVYWEQAWKQAEAENDSSNPFNMVGMMMAPAWYISTPLNALGIQAPMIKGKPEAISPLPVTRTASAVQGTLKGTSLEFLGNLVGLAAKPEQWVRQKTGLNEFGEYGDFYIDRALASMAAEKVITPREAEVAMIDRKGAVYEQAVERVRQEQALRTPGMLPLRAAATGNVGALPGAIAAGAFPGGIMAQGEVRMRELYGEAGKAYTAKEAGDKEAVSKFYEQNPEYAVRSYQYDTPDERLKRFLQADVWEQWNSLPDLYKTEASKAFGEKFQRYFLNKETRDYGAIETDELVQWANALRKAPGNKAEQMPEQAKANGAMVQYSPLDKAMMVQQYKETRDKLFPGLMDALNAYYSLPEAEQTKMYQSSAALRGMMDAYNAWKDMTLANNPQLIPLVGSGEIANLPVDVQTYIYKYRAAAREMFPNWERLQEQYYALEDKKQRAQFLAKYPELGAYWDFREKAAAENSKAAPYILSAASLKSKILGESTPKRSAEEEKEAGAYYNERDRLFPKIGDLFENFYNLPIEEQQRIREAHPEMDKYTRWKNEYLAAHPAAIPLVTGTESELYGLPVEITWGVYQYRASRDRLYPNLNREQDEYYAIQDSAGRKAYLKAHPDLQEYWGWREKIAAANPKIAPYILSEDTLKEKILTQAPKTSTLTVKEMSKFSPELIQIMVASAYNGRSIGEGAYLELKRIWRELEEPYGSVDAWIEKAVKPTFKR